MKPRSVHRFTVIPTSCLHIELRLAGHRIVNRSVQLPQIDLEFAELLELLNSREQFDELSALLEHSPRPFYQNSEEERKLLVARAAAMMWKGSA